MDVEKIKKWLEMTNEYQKEGFWTRIFNSTTPNEFFKQKIDYPKYDIYQNETHI